MKPDKPTADPIAQLGPAIRALRLKRGYPQEEVEYRTGVAQETISGIENGHNRNPLLRTIYKLAKFLGVTIDDLLNGHGGH